MEELSKRSVRVDGHYFNECVEHENIDRWMGKNPYSKYYKDCDKEFWFYACHTPIPGQFYQDDKATYVEDFRTAERYKEYRESGLNILYLQANDCYSGEDFETSQLKKNLDNAKKGGVDKVVITDIRLHALSAMKEPLIGEGRTFAAYDDLLNYVKECIKPYKDYENGLVIGVMLRDEPTFMQLPQITLMQKAISEVWKGAYVDVCLLPFDNGIKSLYEGEGVSQKDTIEESYVNYIENYLKWSQSKYLMMDSYPLRVTPAKDGSNLYYIIPSHFRGLQLIKEVCKKYGAQFFATANTCEMSRDIDANEVWLLWPNEDELYWQNNAYMMFGSKAIAYYTYWSKTFNSRGGYHTEGKAFLTLDGQKTELYYYMQNIHKEMQDFAKVILNFEYQKVNYYKKEKLFHSTEYLNFDKNASDFGDFSAIKGVSQHHSCVALITEMYDKNNDQLMYCVFNPSEPRFAELYDNSCEITLEFDSKYRAVELWHKGKMVTMALVNNKIKFNIDAGHMICVLPY